MAIKFICDGCKKEVDGTWYPAVKKQLKPDHWFCRADENGEQHACSRECVETISKEKNVTSVIAPI